jgi:ATP-binding cassette subfamily B protein
MATFWRLLTFLRPYRAGVIGSLVLAALAMVATVAIPYLTGRAIDQVRAGDSHALMVLGGAVAVAGVLRLALTVSRRLVAGQVSLGVEYDLRTRLYTHFLGQELAFFDRQQTGQLMSRATVDLSAVRFFLGYGLVFLLQSGLTIVLASAAMFLTDPGLAALALIPVPFVVVIATRFGRESRPAIQAVQQRLAELSADVEENISGVRVVKAFAAEDRQLQRFNGTVDRVFDQAMISTRLQAFYNPFIGFLPQLGLAAILFFGGRRVIDGSLTTGQFTAFYTYLLMLLGPMRQLGVALGLSQRATASGARLFEILDREPRIRTSPEARPLPEGNGEIEFRDVTLRYEGTKAPALSHVDLRVPAGQTLAVVGATGSGKTALVQLVARLFELLDREPRITASAEPQPLPPGSGRVELRDVTLAYDQASEHAEPALRDVSLIVEPGTNIALVGATGSGKTTLVQLIARLYDPTSGSVLVDGADVRTLDPHVLRAQVAVVNDDPFLFSDTIHANIAYARGEASREEVVEAARRAQAHDFITALPDGYDTRVGERGLTLSGGQRQRIAIARALLADPRVLILDDATSSIDASTEREIQTGLEAAMAGRTTFVIAHRLSTIALADEIAILDAGRLVDRGTHAELMKSSPFYREIVEKGLPDQVFLTRKPLEPEVAGL